MNSIVEFEDQVFTTSSHTMHADLMAIIINTCKALPNVWQKMNSDQQQDFLESIDKQVGDLVEDCVKTIAADGRSFVMAKCAQVTFKGPIEAKLILERNPDGSMPGGAHDLADQTGQSVMIILPSLDEYQAEDSDKPKPEEDQPDLLDSADDELFDDAVQFIRETGKTSISALQRELKVGYNRAARLVEMLERSGYVGPIGDNGQRELL